MTQKRLTCLLVSFFLFFVISESPRFQRIAEADRFVGSDHFVKIAEKIKPSVVNITLTHPGEPKKGRFRILADRLFGIKRTKEIEDVFTFILFQEYPQRFFLEKLAGSGVIIRSDGLILTNDHVVATEGSLEVILSDGRKFPAQVVGRDYLTDLALIKIEAEHLPVVRFGNSDELRVGQWVLAIGNSLGLQYTVSAGIVSAKERNLIEQDSRPYLNMVQTDAPINLGNSGGPLVNMKGEVVGINTSIIPGGQSIGFATPINDVKRVLAELIAKGKVERGWVGVTFRRQQNTTGSLVVDRVFSGGPSEKAGLQAGDSILTVNDVAMSTPKELSEMIQNIQVGSTIRLLVKRSGKTVPLEFLLEPMPIFEFKGRKNYPPGFEGFILRLPHRTRWLLIIGTVLFCVLLVDVNIDIERKKWKVLQRRSDRRGKERRAKVVPIEEIRVTSERRGVERRSSDRREKKHKFIAF